MFRVRVLSASLLFSSTFTACGIDGDDAWLPPSSSGKADGVQLLDGSDIPSQYVSATKHYLSGRRIDSLERVRALADKALAVAQRADGIIANQPANGRLEASELVRLESPQIFGSLFADEKAQLPTLWRLLESKPNGTTLAGFVPDMTLTERRTEPGGLTLPTSVKISSLPSSYQTVASRVQLVSNGDGNASTIQLTDVDYVLANPAAFTPSEIEIVKWIKTDIMARGTSVVDARVVVPMPGHTATTKMLGTLALEVDADVVVRERRYWSDDHSDFYNPRAYWGAELTVDANMTATLHTRQQDAVVLIELDTTKEFVLEGSDVQLPAIAASDVVIERYAAGTRAETHNVAFPAFSPGVNEAVFDRYQYVDYDLVLANGTKLVKNIKSSARTSTWTYEIEYAWETTAKAPPGDSYEQQIVGYTSLPSSELPAGRYEQALSNGEKLYLDLYPQGVVFARIGNESRRMTYSVEPHRTSAPTKLLSTYIGNVSIEFTAPGLKVDGVAYTLTALQRIK